MKNWEVIVHLAGQLLSPLWFVLNSVVVTSVVCVKFCEIFSLLAGDFCSPDITVTVDWAYKEQVTY